MNILKSWYKKINVRIIALVAISLIIVIFIIGFSKVSSNKQEKKDIIQTNIQVPYQKLPKAHSMAIEEDMNKQLKTNVTFNEDRIIVSNGETIDWKDCTLELNRGIVNKGYVYRMASLSPQNAITIQLKNFTKDGIVFNPSQTKAQNLTIMCNDVAGQSGWNYFSNK